MDFLTFMIGLTLGLVLGSLSSLVLLTRLSRKTSMKDRPIVNQMIDKPSKKRGTMWG